MSFSTQHSSAISLSNPHTQDPQSQSISKSILNTPPTTNSDAQILSHHPSSPQGPIADLAVESSDIYMGPGLWDNYLYGLNPSDDFVHFGITSRQTYFLNPSDFNTDYDSPNSDASLFYGEKSSSEFIEPSVIFGSACGLPVPPALPNRSTNVGCLWPGKLEQQTALTEAQIQQKHELHIPQQQRQNTMTGQSRQQPQQLSGSHQPPDPLIEKKISQLLNSMRHGSVTTEVENELSIQNVNIMAHAHRVQKDDEEMDGDEKLLASEEGKKLSSKERRQLRNRVSARAFRSRRKGENTRARILE
jgi:hypothetical protein